MCERSTTFLFPFFPRYSGERAASVAGDRAEAGDGEVQQAPGGHGDVHHRAEKGHQGTRRHVSGESLFWAAHGVCVFFVFGRSLSIAGKMILAIIVSLFFELN